MSNILVIKDAEGKNLVVLPQVIFYGKRSISWKEVETYLLRYVGDIFEVEDSKDIIYIGKDFADEFAHSSYTKKHYMTFRT